MNEPIPPENKLRIEYQKSHSFRVIHSDGAYGGTSPRLQLFIAFCSERFPLPKVLTYQTSAAALPKAKSFQRENPRRV